MASGTRAAAARLSIGGLARATGIPVETLRTWEARYGFPVPERKESGHRVYPASNVPRLRRMAEALSHGLRAGEIVGASDAALDEVLRATGPHVPSPAHEIRAAQAPGVRLADALHAVSAFDHEALTRSLLTDSLRLGAVEFLDAAVVPLVRAVGEEWAAGRLDVSHEHFLTARLSDLLSSMRLPHDDRAAGPLVVLTTLPGEQHALGLQMAALVVAAAGCRVLYLGTETPLDQVAAAARARRARAVAVSMSAANRGAAMGRRLARLRALMPRHVALLVGGDGAPKARPGMIVLADLRALDAWARSAHPSP